MLIAPPAKVVCSECASDMVLEVTEEILWDYFFYKSTQFAVGVVLFGKALRYNNVIKTQEVVMNTDKLYAEQLANEYAPKDTSKVVALRKLDARAKLPATVFTYTFGIVSALIMGVGMCLSMKVIGNGSAAMMVLGIAVGIIGMIGMGINYPIYKRILNKGKRKYAFDILQLAKEITEE